MSVPTIADVRAWQTGSLWSTADGLTAAAGALDEEVNAIRKAMDAATVEWRGPAADAARERVIRELRDGDALVAAVRAVRDLLLRAAGELGSARAELLVAVEGAFAGGFRVADDGSVAVAPLPPVMTTPAGAAAAAAEREARQSELQCRAGGVGGVVAAALQAVIDADLFIADGLNRIEVPASMQARVDELLGAAGGQNSLDGFLAWGAGGVAAFQGAKGTLKLADKFLALLTGNYDRLVFGPSDGGLLRHALGTPNARLLGKAFLPLTMASGLYDTFGPSDYDGAREWASRGFGLAGATGAVGLMGAAGMLGPGAAGLMIAAGPVGLGVAGAAVVAYGAWELGNLVYDNHEAIEHFASKTVEWTGDRLRDIADVGKKLLPDVKLPDLNPF